MFKSHRILVLCQNYPSKENPFAQPFIHSRLLDYQKHFDVTVLNFVATNDYVYEGIKVITEKSFDTNYSHKVDVVISHAVNIRNHQRFILNNFNSLENFVFIFHGYEVIDILKRVYSQKTLFSFSEKITPLMKIYHKLKLPVTFSFLKLLSKIKKTHFVFVSQTLLDEVKSDLNSKTFFNQTNTQVIHNPINKAFYKSKYEYSGEFDYICLRPFDDPKYGIDLFIEMARNNPSHRFHLYGKGTILNETDLPKNLEIKRNFINPEELPALLNKYKAAILPTRWDSQGVLACEIAEFGMPLLTSDLKVCREFLGKHENVQLISNESFPVIKVDEVKLNPSTQPIKKFDMESTSQKEIDLIYKTIKGSC